MACMVCPAACDHINRWFLLWDHEGWRAEGCQDGEKILFAGQDRAQKKGWAGIQCCMESLASTIISLSSDRQDNIVQNDKL